MRRGVIVRALEVRDLGAAVAELGPGPAWLDDGDADAERATFTLAAAGIVTKIFNHKLCVLDEQLWPFAVRSISDWKNDYLEICDHCSVRDTCGGVFATSGNRLSRAQQAALDDPGAALWTEISGRRAASMRLFVAGLAGVARLRLGPWRGRRHRLGHQRPEMYQLLAGQRGWSLRLCGRFLAGIWQRLLLAGEGPGTSSASRLMQPRS